MAVVKKNIITEGLSGMLGDTIVFRRRYGQTIVSQKPEASFREPSELEVNHRAKFRNAVIYAKAAIHDGDLGPAYDEAAKKQRGKSPYNIAVADFFNVPEIREVDLSGYHGEAGQVIVVTAYDDFMVKEVRITIQRPDGTLVEMGMAEEASPGIWHFTAQQSNPDFNGGKITIEVMDHPGNVAFEEKVIQTEPEE